MKVSVPRLLMGGGTLSWAARNLLTEGCPAEEAVSLSAVACFSLLVLEWENKQKEGKARYLYQQETSFSSSMTYMQNMGHTTGIKRVGVEFLLSSKQIFIFIVFWILFIHRNCALCSNFFLCFLIKSQLITLNISQSEPLPGFSPANRKLIAQHDIRFM